MCVLSVCLCLCLCVCCLCVCVCVQKLTSTIFILALAGTDFLTCLLTIPFTIAVEALDFKMQVDFFCKLYHFLITTTVPFSAFVMVAIAVDRYLCICHPFLHWMTERRAKFIIAALVLFTFFIGAIVCVHYSVYGEKDIPLPNTPSTWTTPHTPGHAVFHTLPGLGHALNHTLQPAYNFSLAHLAGTGSDISAEPSFTSGLSSSLSSSSSSPPPKPTTSIGEGENLTVRAITHIFCDRRKDTIDITFFDALQRIYSAFFLVSCVSVLVLYSLIYRSVIAQRRKKLRIRSATCCFLWDGPGVSKGEPSEVTTALELSQANGEHTKIRADDAAATDELRAPSNGSSRAAPTSRTRLERMRMANIKTALMLFVVTLVFIISFLPAWLIALEIVKLPVIVFYMYFFYNVVNPIIYAFMNQTFRAELQKLFACRR